jgi:hypothetical protein
MPRPLPSTCYAEVTTADGVKYRWDANQAPGSRPQNLSFRTRSAKASATPACSSPGGSTRTTRTSTSGTLVLTGADGSIAYEGTSAAMPRDLSDTHSIGVTLGRVDGAREGPDVPGDLRRPGRRPVGRHAARAQAGCSASGSASVTSQYAPSRAADVCALPNQALGAQTIAEAWYQAPPGCKVAKIGYRGKTVSFPAGYAQRLIATDLRDRRGRHRGRNDPG